MSDSPDVAGFVAPDAADLAPLFPGYEIQSLIATGGMGAVYCAVQKSLDRRVALKILPLELSKDAAFCAGFEAEAKAMARLNHPNLIGVYDFGEVKGMLYIIMEFVPGKSIYHSADGIAIDPGEVIRLVTGICQGLAHAHENGIIHRDIKPSNILLDLNAQPKIGDFGLARPFERKIEEGEEIFGTPHYTAPEVVDTPYSVDYRADIFSVGVLLHELLTGKLPANDPRPASVIAHCDVRFDAIIKRATQPLPSARYSSANELAKELQAIARAPKTSGSQTVGIGVPRPVVPRHSHVVKAKKQSSSASSVFLLIVVVAAAAAAYHFLSKKPTVQVNGPVVIVPAPKPPPTPPDPTEEVPVETPTEIRNNPLPVDPPAIVQEERVPEVVPEQSTPPEETVVTPETVAPKSDVTAFFVRARKVMQDRATPLIKTHDDKLKDNVSGLRRDLERAIRKYGYYRDTSETYMDEHEADWKKAGNRIPPVLDGWVATVPDATKIYTEHLEKQAEIDTNLKNGLAANSETYILGLTKQIERLKLEKDVGAIALIEKEIESTKESPKYFAELMGASRTGDSE
jgi:serine/threonine protein kinase